MDKNMDKNILGLEGIHKDLWVQLVSEEPI